MEYRKYHKTDFKNSTIKTNYMYSQHGLVKAYFKKTSKNLFIEKVFNITYFAIFIISNVVRAKNLEFKWIISNFFLSSNLKDQLEYQQYFQCSFLHFFLRSTYLTILLFCFCQCLLSINLDEILQNIFTITGKTAYCASPEEVFFLKMDDFLGHIITYNPYSPAFLNWANTWTWAHSQSLCNEGYTYFYKLPATHEIYSGHVVDQETHLEKCLKRVALYPGTLHIECENHIWVIKKAQQLFMQLSIAEDNYITSIPFARYPNDNFNCVLDHHLNGLVLKGSPFGTWAFYQDLQLQEHRFINVNKSLHWYNEFSLAKFYMQLDMEGDRILGYEPKTVCLYTYDIPNEPRDNLLPARGVPAGVRLQDHDPDRYAALAPPEPFDDAHRVEHIANRLATRLVQKILSELP